jgi:hypothetical protein
MLEHRRTGSQRAEFSQSRGNNSLKAGKYDNCLYCFAPCLHYLVEDSPSGGNVMKAFIAALICAAAIGVGASYVLHMQQETVDVAFSTSSARVGDPGQNLVGVN